jgi:pyridoxine 5-phosphate synthase
MTRLSVNINKVATLRNARGGKIPDVVQFAQDCERFGAEGITVHPRPDERHIRYSDVRALKEVVTTEFNIEGYPSDDFLLLIESIQPHQVTLVPDPPGAITSSFGWDAQTHFQMLSSCIGRIQDKTGARVSLFVDPNPLQIEWCKRAGAHRVELYTEPFATHFPTDPHAAVASYLEAAKAAVEVGLGLNAGHDLSLHNLPFLIKQIPEIEEVSIGHALIADALYYGIENTIRLYLNAIRTASLSQ